MNSVGRAQVVTSGLLRGWPLPDPSGDKNSSGRVLVVGGNDHMPGAVLLSAEAAMRAGAGKLQIATVEAVVAPLGVAIPEGYVQGLPTDDGGDLGVEGASEILRLARECDAVLIGPGIMDPGAAVRLLSEVVPHLDAVVCLDALALAYLTDNPDGVRHLEGRCVLSPNLTELFVTLGAKAPDDPDSSAGKETIADATLRLAEATGAVVLSGAATSYIATPEGELWADEAGGQGLAVSGSGDVKAGVVAGLVARGATPAQAAVWADHVHGRVGERLASEYGPRGFMARDLLPGIPREIAALEH